jgi:hypothetical protein
MVDSFLEMEKFEQKKIYFDYIYIKSKVERKMNIKKFK